MMKSKTRITAVVLVVIGAMIAGSVMAQQIAPPASQQPPAATATHSDPIVQKRMEIRDANREQRAKNAEAKKAYKSDVKQAKSERNQSAQESRARAQESLNAE
ncbi:hypothetical protein [Paraburkholderia sp. J67]|uniref:hypothetical protein n=1 Tax=Paraburkholderia sp. J67 TaxID=2805435 RepID=UPI002ABDED68|nr:hypothetical protein [Paraburkholderia sp. J67]